MEDRKTFSSLTIVTIWKQLKVQKFIPMKRLLESFDSKLEIIISFFIVLFEEW